MWIPITLLAATLQILRTSRQHELRSVLSANAAGFVRYLYGAPFAIAVSVATFGVAGRPVPSIPARFWPIVAAAGTAQILATIALLQAFRMRNFALGTVYSKTEVIQVAIVSALVLHEPLRLLGWVGAIVCTLGVAWLAANGSLRSLVSGAADPAALMGIAAGGAFAIAAVGIRAASKSLGDGPAWDRAMLTLTVMLVIQTVINAGQLAVTDADELRTSLMRWRQAVPVGFFSLAGSAAWALAVTLENAAKVRTLGQVELVIAFAVSHHRLGERHERREYIASAVVITGIVAVAMLG
jgi:drug/metabolite transporter (DMT)-like permease